MKLLDSLYTVTSVTPTDNGHEFDISLNSGHFIYQAHFPGEPITPGVCIMQIAVELFELSLNVPLSLSCVKNIKFLRIISSDEVTEVRYSLQKITREDDELKVQVVVSAAGDVYAKLSLICKEN